MKIVMLLAVATIAEVIVRLRHETSSRSMTIPGIRDGMVQLPNEPGLWCTGTQTDWWSASLETRVGLRRPGSGSEGRFLQPRRDSVPRQQRSRDGGPGPKRSA